MTTARLLPLCGMFILFAAPCLRAAPISPLSYDMQNGQGTAIGGNFNYWDSTYSSAGTSADGASLTGGLGDLTDGIIASSNWNVVENLAGTGPYVGWQKDHTPNPLVTFRFGASTLLNSVTIYVDDSEGYGGVSTPASVDIRVAGGTYKNFLTPSHIGPDPTSYSFNDLGLTGSAFEVRINHASDWVFVSEVELDGQTAAVPEPATFLLSAAGLLALGLAARLRRR